jgi:hypothetical protein
MLSDVQATASRIVKELWEQNLIPFELHIGQLTLDVDQYTIYFYDRRFHLVVIPLEGEGSFEDRFREAVLREFATRGWPVNSE